ncbi:MULTISPECIES: hypothetical protein [Halomonas]|nr:MULTISPECIES: hypothetical protein [Halomonas]
MAEPIKEGNVLESRGKFDVAFVLAAGIALSGCASQQALEPESHSFMGMPSGSKEEVADMFRVPDHWPDGAPTKAIHRGKETGVWQPVGSTEGSCIEYRLIPNDERYKAPEQPHYWDGAMFRPTKANCIPVQDQLHSRR